MNDQLRIYRPEDVLQDDMPIQRWNDEKYKIRDYPNYLQAMGERGVYFSYPLDLDLAMLLAYPEAYEVDREVPNEATLKNVLGNSYFDENQYGNDEKELFKPYHQMFKLGSKPANHIKGLANLTNEQILANMPDSINSLIDNLIIKLRELPE